MVRIIIEFSEGYLHERADLDNLKDKIAANPNLSFPKLMCEAMTFAILEKEVNNGKKELLLTSDGIEDEKTRSLFNDAVFEAACAVYAKEGDKKRGEGGFEEGGVALWCTPRRATRNVEREALKKEV